MSDLEVKALTEWLNRCVYEKQCSEYHKLNYECQCAIEQRNCVLYHLFKVRVIKAEYIKPQ